MADTPVNGTAADDIIQQVDVDSFDVSQVSLNECFWSLVTPAFETYSLEEMWVGLKCVLGKNVIHAVQFVLILLYNYCPCCSRLRSMGQGIDETPALSLSCICNV